MATRIEQMAEALNELAVAVENSNSANNTMREQFGWQFPDLNRYDIAKLASHLADRLETIPDATVNSKYSVTPVVAKITFAKESLIPQFWNGNGLQAYTTYAALLQWIDDEFRALYPKTPDWEVMDAERLLPKQLSSRLRALNNQIKKLSADRETLDEKVSYIEQAHEAAVALPTDLESLREATKEVEELKAAAAKSRVLADEALSNAEEGRDAVEASREEAVKLVENIEDAYSAATTKGLGQAFQERAVTLANSMWIWVGGLVVTLALGAWAGSHRVTILEGLLDKNASAGIIWLNTVLAFFSVAAPVWFAWIATKQIGHRFRLSEDYAFKASVARAYEGYRREAARLDVQFAKKLFDSALNRLDEAPIRFVEHETFGSPWHEALRMRAARKAARENHTANRDVTPPAPTADDE